MTMILKNQQKNSYKTADKNIKLSDQSILIKKRLLKITYVILVFIVFMFVTPITKVNSFFENNPDIPTEELLDQIRSSCQQHTQTGPSNVAMALPTFSALLVRLSNEASKTADKNITIQRNMMIITAVILAISIFQLVLTFFHFSPKFAVQSQSIVSAPETKSSEKGIKNKTENNNIAHSSE